MTNKSKSQDCLTDYNDGKPILNTNQLLFCHLIATGLKQVNAYQQAFKGSTYDNASNCASKLMKKDYIRSQIEELRAPLLNVLALQRSDISRLRAEIATDSDVDPSARIAAMRDEAKMRGFDEAEKTEHKISIVWGGEALSQSSENCMNVESSSNDTLRASLSDSKPVDIEADEVDPVNPVGISSGPAGQGDVGSGSAAGSPSGQGPADSEPVEPSDSDCETETGDDTPKRTFFADKEKGLLRRGAPQEHPPSPTPPKVRRILKRKMRL